MPSLSQIITDHAAAFADMPDVAKVIESISAKVKELGYAPILAGNAKDKPDYVPYERVEELTGHKNTLTTQNGELTVQLEAMKKAVKGNEDLVAQITDLQKQIDSTKGANADITKKFAVKFAALVHKAKDAGDLEKFLDMSKLVVGEGDVVTGLNEQIEELKKSKTYLFGEGTSAAGGDFSASSGGEPTAEQISVMSQVEYEAYRNKKT